MAVDLKSRKVIRFRTHLDPMIPPKARNAFDKNELKNWEFELLPVGVYVKCFWSAPGGISNFEEHIVPFSNVQSIKLAPIESEEKAK